MSNLSSSWIKALSATIALVFLVTICGYFLSLKSNSIPLVPVSLIPYSKISLLHSSGSLVLERRGDQWQVIYPVHTLSAPKEIDRLLSLLQSPETMPIVTSDPAQYSTLGVSENHSRIDVVGYRGETSSIFVGNDASFERSKSVRISGDGNVYTSSHITEILDTLSLEKIRNRKFIDQGPQSFVNIDIKDSANKNISSKKTDSHTPVTSRIHAFIELFSGVQIDTFPNSLEITVQPETLRRDYSYKIYAAFNDRNTATVYFKEDNGVLYAYIEGENDIVILPNSFLDALEQLFI